MKRVIIGLVALAAGSFAVPAFAAPPNVVSYSVAVCDPNFPKRCVAPSTNGGQFQGQALPTTTITAVAASTATAIDVPRPTRVALEVQTETATTSVAYICFQAACSASVHDKVIAVGAVGILYTAPYGMKEGVWLFTTQIGVITVNSSSWLPE